MRALILAILLVLVAGAGGVTGARGVSGGGGLSGTPAPGITKAPPISAAKLLGQRVMVGFPGLVASPSLLGRIRRGEIGSVILFAGNISTRTQLRALTSSLQHAARAGGNPQLFIAVDQEGGQVKRLTNGPPDLAPPQMVARGGPALASHEGKATGSYLHGLGINMDLAPVVDVPTFPAAFIWQQGRAFSFKPATVASYAGAFAFGLQSAHVAATAKHFPGDGSAGVDTDFKLDILRPSAAQRAGALVPYRALIPRGLDAVMVTTARFPAYDPAGTPAALSAPVIQGLLRQQLHFKGVAITDALGAPTGHDETTAGVLAARAGADILLYTDAASGTLPALEAAMKKGQITHSQAVASYQRIVALKRRVP